MSEVTVRHEFPTSLHVAVSDAKSERSAVQLSRNFAARHYGGPVGHYVSSGYSDGAWTYVYSNPNPPRPSRRAFRRSQLPGMNSRQRRREYLLALAA